MIERFILCLFFLYEMQEIRPEQAHNIYIKWVITQMAQLILTLFKIRFRTYVL
jgi:hypothetical protein